MKPSNVLHIPTKSEDWSDKDVVLVHAMFTLLQNFVELEWRGVDQRIEWLQECIEEGGDRGVWATSVLPKAMEIKELYDWWMERKDTRENEIDEPLYSKDDEMMHRLVDLRGWMWT